MFIELHKYKGYFTNRIVGGKLLLLLRSKPSYILKLNSTNTSTVLDYTRDIKTNEAGYP